MVRNENDVVITGIGVINATGVGKTAFWDALCEGRSGIGPIRRFDASALPVRIAGEIADFKPAQFVKPRKALKVMARDAQLGIAASTLACEDAGLQSAAIDPERCGAIFAADRISGDLSHSVEPYRRCIVDGRFDFSRWGTEAYSVSFPLSFLKVLPNMVAAHISIAHDCRGPCNTIHHAEVSGLLAVIEAARIIERGAADVMIAGGASSQMQPFDWACHCVKGGLSPRNDDPRRVCRPFDALRDGQVLGEGAAALILERRSHAVARGAAVLATVQGWGRCCRPSCGSLPSGEGIERAVTLAVQQAAVPREQIAHVNAHGLSMVHEDRIEAQALHRVVPEVPVTALKGYFGNLGAASGVTELAASILALQNNMVPQTLNYEHPDPDCPVRVVAGGPAQSSGKAALSLNWTRVGQAVAVMVSRDE